MTSLLLHASAFICRRLYPSTPTSSSPTTATNTHPPIPEPNQPSSNLALTPSFARLSHDNNLNIPPQHHHRSNDNPPRLPNQTPFLTYIPHHHISLTSRRSAQHHRSPTTQMLEIEPRRLCEGGSRKEGMCFSRAGSVPKEDGLLDADDEDDADDENDADDDDNEDDEADDKDDVTATTKTTKAVIWIRQKQPKTTRVIIRRTNLSAQTRVKIQNTITSDELQDLLTQGNGSQDTHGPFITFPHLRGWNSE